MSSSQENGAGQTTALGALIVRYGIGAVLIVFLLTSGLHFGYTPDDTYIYLQHAKHIARGDGYSFNAGLPGYGITAPLWTALIAAGTAADLDPYIVAKALDLVFAGLAVIVVLAFAFILIRDPLYALVAAWIFSFDASFLRWSGSGMESSLAVLLVMLTLWYAYKKEYLTSSLIAGLLTLVRPEGVLLLLAVLVDVPLNGRDRKSVVRTMGRMGIVYAVVVGAWFLFSVIVLGSTGLSHSLAQMASPQTLWGTTRTMAEIVGATQLLPALAMVAGVGLAVKRIGWQTFREDVFPLGWIVAVPLAVIAANFRVDSRTMLLISPLIAVYGVWGIKRLEIASVLSPRHSLILLIVMAGVSLVQNQVVFSTWILPHMENYQLGVNECLKPMGFWLKANTPPEAKVLAPNVGVIGYVSDREMEDGTGRFGPMRGAFRDVQAYDYVIERTVDLDVVGPDSLKPIMTRTFSGTSVRDAGMYYYKLLKVTK